MLMLSQISIPISTRPDQWIVVEVLRDEFIHAQSADDAQLTVDEAGEATTLLFARFLGFVADRVRATSEDAPEHAARLALLLAAVSHFTTTLLLDIDIHSLVASYENEARKKVLSAFYVAHAVLVKYNVEGTPKLVCLQL
jgi:fatty acid synthase subunit alpha, fungi type